jgi:Holliday junction resolvase RusA-like endonuclease
MQFEIPGRLPGTNEIIDAAKKKARNYKEYAVMKAENTDMVAWIVKQLPKYNKINLTITWYEPNEKRDPDNIMGGQKFIFDGLVRAGTISDDSRKYIGSITHRFGTDRKNPHIEVEIEEVEKSETEHSGTK